MMPQTCPPAPADRCPECVGPLVSPHATEPTPGGRQGVYHCNECGHDWTCAWVIA